MNKKNKVIILMTFTVLIIAVLCFYFTNKTESFSLSDYAMGTVISATVYGEDGENTVNEIFSSIKNDEKYISKNIEGSDISVINEKLENECNAITVDTVTDALKVCEDSNGALDISLGNLSDLWNIDGENPSVPADEDIKEIKKHYGYEKISVKDNVISIPDGMSIDLGAVGKGKAADSAYDVLAEKGVYGAIVSVGGTVLVYGDNPGGDCWTVGIRAPDGQSAEYFATLKIKDTKFISTSGSYEKYFECGGEIYHHIFDRKTGYPARSGVKSVTVICDKGIYADALSTACFVLGYENSLTLLEKYNANAVFVLDDNTVKVTEDIKKDLSIVDSRYGM